MSDYPNHRIAFTKKKTDSLQTMTTSAIMILHRLRSSRLPFLPTAQQVVSSSGAFRSLPHRISLGLTKVVALTIPTVYIGAEMGRISASLLEDWNIFVPDDDDDD